MTDSLYGQTNVPTYTLSSEHPITTRHVHRLLVMLRANFITNARAEAPGACVYRGKIETTLRVRIMDQITDDRVVELWEKMRTTLCDLDLTCSWLEWGSYKGCIYRLEARVDP